jgi:hypothetical protein
MIKPLYLDPAWPWQVRLDDGPALNVSTPGHARSLFPLQRLARVISPSHAQWSTPALVSCLRAGVPVIFHDATGDPVAWCFGPRKRETTLGSLLREAIAQPQGIGLIEGWRQAAERREILDALHDFNTYSHKLDTVAVRAHLCNLHRVRIGQPAGVWLRALRRATAALVAQRLHSLVGDPQLIGFASEGLHLGQTLSDLLEWPLHRVLHATPVLAITQSSPTRFAADAIERHGAALHRCCGELAGGLEHLLRENLT